MSRTQGAGLLRRLLWIVAVLLSAPPLFFFITTPMDASRQALLGIGSVVLLLVVNRVSPGSRRVSLWLTVLSVLVSTRYLYWRATETLVFGSGLEALLGYGLFLAELYAWVILVLGYLQTLWPLEREVCPLPADNRLWPTVDIYIPTYNESLSVVADTVLAAQNLAYPQDKLSIYILDDGRRTEFAAFANEAGVGYIRRKDNNHAKAGNLNHAMTLTKGELICVFDCDHVPTRGFLQATVGGFLHDPRLALLQTPHYFYSPDPFERNIRAADQIPREGELFYGPVQKGNDFWNAAFFCGSCAVIRRTALEETNGFAVETVTEDAHTALKLQRTGWNTAFLSLPLAAGLATERLSLHIGQRARWARGMTQIMRRDNPLFGRGLSMMQRLCYLNAMLHFQFALPRIVFLTAPLAYLLAGQNIIASSAAMIFAYALPHLVHAILTNSRLTGRYRYSFWGEIYESVLAFHLVRPTLVTLFDPMRGKFNVTDKGGLMPRAFFDSDTVRPHVITALLLAAGVGWGIIRFAWDTYYDIERDVMLLNLFWATFSLIMLLAAISVARETRQVRESVRVDVDLPVALYLEDGHVLRTRTEDLSMTGARIRNPMDSILPSPVVAIEVSSGGEVVTLPSRTIASDLHSVRLVFEEMNVSDRRRLVRVVMGRADAWLRDRPQTPDRPLRSLFLVVLTAIRLFLPQQPRKAVQQQQGDDSPSLSFRVGAFLAFTALLLVMLWLAIRPAFAATDAAAGQAETQGTAELAGTELRFSQLGYVRGVTLRGDGAQAGVGFAVPGDHVVTDAALVLRLRVGERLLPDRSRLQVELNGQTLRNIPLNALKDEQVTVRIPVNPALIVAGNRINFRLRGLIDEQCHIPHDPDIHATVTQESALYLVTRPLPLANELARLPAPFLYPESSARVTVPIVLPPEPDEAALRAAAIVASWLGARADYRGTAFDVYLGLPGSPLPGHAIIFSSDEQMIDGLTIPDGEGGRIAMRDNPLSPPYKLLHLHAPESADLVDVARFMVLSEGGLRGVRVEAGEVRLPRYELRDLPGWVNANAPLRLGDLVDPESLRVTGVFPPLMNIDFRTDPALYLGPGDTVPLKLGYRFPDGDWLDTRHSRLDVALNGEQLKSLPVNRPGLLEGLWSRIAGRLRQEETVILVPPHLLYGQNQLSFYFNMQPLPVGDCDRPLPSGAVSYIDPDSTLDMSRALHFARLPELGHFVAAGHPFTEYADLSTTVVVVPEEGTAPTLAAMLDMMGRLGEVTGVPATGVSLVQGARALARFPAHHRLAVAPLSDPLVGDVMTGSAFQWRQESGNGRVRVRPLSWQDRWRNVLAGDWKQQRAAADRALTSRERVSGLFSWYQPEAPDYGTVLLTAQQDTMLPALTNGLRDPQVSAGAWGDMVLYNGSRRLASYRAGPYRMQGDMTRLRHLQWSLGERPLILLSVMAVLTLLLALLMAPALRRRAARRLLLQQPREQEPRE